MVGNVALGRRHWRRVVRTADPSTGKMMRMKKGRVRIVNFLSLGDFF